MLLALPELNVNEICAILRLYVEMDVQQATFYEGVARHIEMHVNQLDEGGLLNAIVAFKQAPTHKQLSVVTDLEQIMIGNINALQLETISQMMYCYSKVLEADRKS